METGPGPGPDDLTHFRQLIEDPTRYHLFHALRVIEARYRDAPRLGESRTAAQDRVRLGQLPELAFPPATLTSFQPGKGSAPARLSNLFFGLWGPHGPLPLHLTEYARDRLRNHRDPTLVAFADMLTHRVMSLLYRVWASAQPAPAFDRAWVALEDTAQELLSDLEAQQPQLDALAQAFGQDRVEETRVEDPIAGAVPEGAASPSGTGRMAVAAAESEARDWISSDMADEAAGVSGAGRDQLAANAPAVTSAVFPAGARQGPEEDFERTVIIPRPRPSQAGSAAQNQVSALVAPADRVEDPFAPTPAVSPPEDDERTVIPFPRRPAATGARPGPADGQFAPSPGPDERQAALPRTSPGLGADPFAPVPPGSQEISDQDAARTGGDGALPGEQPAGYWQDPFSPSEPDSPNRTEALTDSAPEDLLSAGASGEAGVTSAPLFPADRSPGPVADRPGAERQAGGLRDPGGSLALGDGQGDSLGTAVAAHDLAGAASGDVPAIHGSPGAEARQGGEPFRRMAERAAGDAAIYSAALGQTPGPVPVPDLAAQSAGSGSTADDFSSVDAPAQDNSADFTEADPSSGLAMFDALLGEDPVAPPGPAGPSADRQAVAALAGLMAMSARLAPRPVPKGRLDLSRDRLQRQVAALSGYADGSLLGADAMPDLSKRYFAGLLSSGPRHAEGLRVILEHFFEAKVTIQQFVGQWLTLEKDDTWQLGKTGLGRGTSVGRKVWSRDSKFRLQIGPLDLEDYQRLLPGRGAIERMEAIVRNYVGDRLAWDVQLILKSDQVPKAILGNSAGLGYNCWIGTRLTATKDADDLILTPPSQTKAARALAGH